MMITFINIVVFDGHFNKSNVVINYARILTELLTIVTLARLKYKLPDDGHRPKHVGAF